MVNKKKKGKKKIKKFDVEKLISDADKKMAKIIKDVEESAGI